MRVQPLLVGILTVLTICSVAAAHTIEPVQASLENLSARSLEALPWESEHKVFVFLSDDCPCSRSHVDHLKKLKVQYPDVAFIGVHSDSLKERPESRAYYLEEDFNFPVLRDDAQILLQRFKALKTPHAFLLDKDNQVLFHGGVTDASEFEGAGRFFLQEALAQVTRGEKVQRNYARPLGCPIYRR